MKAFNHRFFKSTMAGVTSVFSSQEMLVLKNLENAFQYHKRKLGVEATEKMLLKFKYEYLLHSCELEGCSSQLLRDLYGADDPSHAISTKQSSLVERFNDDTVPMDKKGIVSKSLTDITMATNHLNALLFVDGFSVEKLLTKDIITRVHSRLVDGLDYYNLSQVYYENSVLIPTGVRCGPVIVGSYSPLESESELLEGLDIVLKLIRQQSDCYSESILTTVLLSYLQLFADANKRTARLLGQAVLRNNHSFPIIYSSADSAEYIDSLVLFYEQNDIGAFKELFMRSAQRSVENFCN